MCNIWKKPVGKEMMPEEIGQFFHKASRFSWVGITGGEPFLRDDIVDIVDAIVKHSPRLCTIHFATNGFLEERIRKAVHEIKKRHKNLKLVFTISIDGPPQLHNYIRGVDGVWEKAISSFCYLKELPNVKAQLGVTISQHNVGRFRETFDAIKNVYPRLRFDDISVNIFQRSGFYYDNQDMKDMDTQRLFDEINKILAMDKEGFSINNFLRRAYLRLYPRYCKLKKTPVKCQALSATMFIDPYGDLFPCSVFNKKLINIKEMHEDLDSLWKGNKARRISHECVLNRCPLCWSPCDAYSAISSSLLKVSFSPSLY